MKVNTINTEKTKALISLLDDTDNFVFDSVKTEILSSGFEIIPELQRAFHASENELKSERLVEILDKIKLEKLRFDIEIWREHAQPDLLEGMLHIARYWYPTLNADAIKDTIDEIVQVVKPKIEGKSPLEIIDILNQIILKDFGFSGNFEGYSALNNSFISKIIETKITNPIGLSIIYLLVAKATGIPLVGINSSGHFILGYLTSEEIEADRIEFFIDPFYNGKIVESDSFKTMIKSNNVPKEALRTLIATEKDIIKRVFNNLIYALYTSGEKNTAEKLMLIAELI